MTVKELKKILRNFDDDDIVLWADHDHSFTEYNNFAKGMYELDGGDCTFNGLKKDQSYAVICP